MNAGQAIKLRPRTGQYDGFRSYNEIRVLCHQLTYNICGDHDNHVLCLFTTCLLTYEFKELNFKLNREVLEFERRIRGSTHTPVGDEERGRRILQAALGGGD